MRKSACICFVFVMMYAVTIAAYAQPMPPHRGQERHRKEIRTPEEIAKIKTERLQKEVFLDDKQFKKIYKIYLKEEQAKQQAMEGNMMPPPGGAPGGFPGGMPSGDLAGDFLVADVHLRAVALEWAMAHLPMRCPEIWLCLL